MSGKSFSATTIILILVVAIAGLGIGYFYSSSNLQPKIDDLSKQVTDKNSQIGALNQDITNKNAKITQLNTTISGLQSQITGLLNDRQSLSAEVAALNQSLKISEDAIKEQDSQLQILTSRTMSSPGYVSLNLFDFSFEAPMNLTISTLGLMDASANSNSGIIKMAKSDNELSVLLWVYRTVVPDIDTSLDTARQSLVPYNPQYGPRTTISVNGYTMKYEKYTATDQNGVAYGVSSYVYCSKLNYYFGISSVFYNEAQTNQLFEHLVDSLYLPN